MTTQNSDGAELIVSWPESQVAQLTLNRPEALNAVTYSLARRIGDVVAELSSDENCRVIIITGSGRAFCAGADLKRSPQQASSMQASGDKETMGDDYFRVIQEIRNSPAPVIAAVNGLSVGFGMAMTLAADIRVVSPQASFAVGAIKIGLTAGESGISWHLPRLIGMSAAMEMMLTGRTVHSEEAASIGLGQAAEDSVAKALDIASDIVGNSPIAVSMTKELAWMNLEETFERAMELEAQAQYKTNKTQDFKEAIAAFLEKRAPVFAGR